MFAKIALSSLFSPNFSQYLIIFQSYVVRFGTHHFKNKRKMDFLKKYMMGIGYG